MYWDDGLGCACLEWEVPLSRPELYKSPIRKKETSFWLDDSFSDHLDCHGQELGLTAPGNSKGWLWKKRVIKYIIHKPINSHRLSLNPGAS